MMTDFNPYEPPKNNVNLAPVDNPDGIQRMVKNKLFVPIGVDLPSRCIKCNQPTDNRKSIKLKKSYAGVIFGSLFLSTFLLAEMGLYSASILIFLYPIVSIVVSLCQKKTHLYFSLCEIHESKRISGSILGFLCFVGSLSGYFYLSVNHSSSDINLIILPFIPLSLIFFTYHYRLIKLVKPSEEGMYIKGFGEVFLESFE